MRSMQRNFLKTMSIVMCTAMLLTVLLIFGLQTFKAQRDARASEAAQVQQVRQIVQDNEESIAALTESINADNIAKAWAFELMIEQDPALIEDAAKLERIKTLLGADELHVMDEKGILRWGTDPTMFGFDFSSGDQTRPFLEALTNRDFALAQEAQPNAVYGVLFQYIGVARQDKPGIVQIGMRPERLEAALESNRIENVLSGIRVGSSGYVFAVNVSDGTVAAHHNADLIGKPAQEIGLPDHFVSDSPRSGFATVDGERVYYYGEPFGDYMLGAAMPESEVYSGRNVLSLIFALCILVIFSFLIILINGLLKKQIIRGIDAISDSLSQITGGDLGVTVDVRTNREFSRLSDGINAMVASIRARIDEASALAEKERRVFEQVRGVSGGIRDVSGRMLTVSQSLSSGAGEQSAAADALSGAFGAVSQSIGQTAERARDAHALSVEMRERLAVGNREMDAMVDSMQEISAHSQKIGNIIKSIDDIAFQTNILALNAAVEAARAGAAGKGFAVVADEVRNLASKSAQSAQDTAALIDETLRTVDAGTQNVERTAHTLGEIIDTAQKSADLIDGITAATGEQTELISGVEQEIEHIATVVQSNAVTAQDSASSSQELSSQAEALGRLVRAEEDAAV